MLSVYSPNGLPCGRQLTRFDPKNPTEYEQSISNMRQKIFCSACKGMNAVSAKRCFYCKSKLKDECLPRTLSALKTKLRTIAEWLPRTLSALKTKLRTIANGTDKGNIGIKYHSVLYMIPYDITDKITYIFSTDGIPKEQGIVGMQKEVKVPVNNWIMIKREKVKIYSATTE